jgi:branched-chain amino acid transport system ATP-binding protein
VAAGAGIAKVVGNHLRIAKKGGRPLLKLKNVDVVFDDVIQVLRSANLEVPEGGIVALLGANGAGKTTTLKAISGLLEVEKGRVTAGEINFGDRNITNMDPCDVVGMGIVQVLEGRKVLSHLTVEQNLRLGAHFRKDKDLVPRDMERICAYFPLLKNLFRRTAGYLSGGEMQMLILGRALIARPKLLLLDEPSMGLAPLLVKEIFERLVQINREEGVTMLLVEQNAGSAIRICDYGYVMENGRIVLHGSRGELEANEDVREFYLGLSLTRQKKNFRDVKHYKRRKRWLG